MSLLTFEMSRSKLKVKNVEPKSFTCSTSALTSLNMTFDKNSRWRRDEDLHVLNAFLFSDEVQGRWETVKSAMATYRGSGSGIWRQSPSPQ